MTASTARSRTTGKRPRRKSGKSGQAPVAEIKTARGLRRALTHRIILAGVSAALVKSAVEHGVLAPDEVYRFIPKSTFARKLRNDIALSVEEGDRLARLARLKAYAGDVFDSDRDAELWLNEENPALGGQTPISLILTDDGARRVETTLRRIDYGDYS
jgi:putative toxin-antitoxin system antitoxin component (TIGR02293 family)